MLDLKRRAKAMIGPNTKTGFDASWYEAKLALAETHLRLTAIETLDEVARKARDGECYVEIMRIICELGGKLRGIEPNSPPPLAKVPEGMTKGELAALVYPNTTFDTALPQQWVNRCMDLGFDPRPCFVWGYPAGTVMGQPLPLTAEAARDIPAEMIS
jgi:hypothetical protein